MMGNSRIRGDVGWRIVRIEGNWALLHPLSGPWGERYVARYLLPDDVAPGDVVRLPSESGGSGR